MAYKISNDCICCDRCTVECPVDAIAEVCGKFEIYPPDCLDCGACARVCPVGAISQE